MGNTWPGGRRHAMSQSQHESWNAKNHPGTRQLCALCGAPTGRDEDDGLYLSDDGDPVCPQCWEADDAREREEE